MSTGIDMLLKIFNYVNWNGVILGVTSNPTPISGETGMQHKSATTSKLIAL